MLVGIVESNRSLKERKEGKERKEKRKGKQSCILLGRFVVLSPLFWGFLGAKLRGELG